MIRKTSFNLLVLLSLLVSMVAMAGLPAAAATPRQAPPQQPQALPPTMPVFSILPTLVNQDTIQRNAALFNGIGATQVVTVTSQGGLINFWAVDPNSHDVVDQFNHTGGLFAENTTRAFTETEMTVNTTNTDICLFLANRQLLPMNEVDPQYTDCRQNPPYTVKQIHLSTVMPATGQGTNTVIGRLVQVPLSINIGIGAPMFIPMGGPGGHLSLVLAGGPNTPSLDSTLPGLQALASPWFGRIRAASSDRLLPDRAAAGRHPALRSAIPEGDASDRRHAGDGLLSRLPGYPAGCPYAEWTFPDATAIISGTVVSLKDSALPGVEGFAPEVNILSPTDGTVVLNGHPVSITFSVTGDKGPFTYTVSSDDNVVASGSTISGTLTLNLGVLPPFIGARKGILSASTPSTATTSPETPRSSWGR